MVGIARLIRIRVFRANSCTCCLIHHHKGVMRRFCIIHNSRWQAAAHSSWKRIVKPAILAILKLNVNWRSGVARLIRHRICWAGICIGCLLWENIRTLAQRIVQECHQCIHRSKPISLINSRVFEAEAPYRRTRGILAVLCPAPQQIDMIMGGLVWIRH